ncbi:MAG: 50S ribosomal protein L6 [Candidatus Paceibacterota bacterium]
MSRLGKQPITLPAGVEVSFEGGVFTVKKGATELKREMKDLVNVEIENNTVTFSPVNDSYDSHALWGTYAAHARNMVLGVGEGFKKVLEIEGVGYRAELKGNTLVLLMGFSHPVEMPVPPGITVAVEKGVVTISGVDKEAVGQFAADVRKVKKPEPYKGKGIRYQGEYVIRKQGKKAV